MPISVQLTEGLLTSEGEQKIFARVADALLAVHGLTGNAFMTPNVIGHLVVTPEATSYVGGKPASLAIVEVKVPSLTFPSHDVHQAFVKRVTDIVDELKAGSHPRSRTFVNVTYTADGSWGIGGKAYTNAELGRSIAGPTP